MQFIFGVVRWLLFPLALKLSWKSRQMTPFFVQIEVLSEKIIIWEKYGNVFTFKIWLKSERIKEPQIPRLVHLSYEPFIFLSLIIWTLVTQVCLEIENVFKFDSLESCKGKKAPVHWREQP